MNRFDQANCLKPAAKFKALGHPVRFWIARELVDGRRCVHEFVEATGLDFSTISQHLAALKHGDIVTCEKRGKEVWYQLTCPCTRTFLACVAEKQQHDRESLSNEPTPSTEISTTNLSEKQVAFESKTKKGELP